MGQTNCCSPARDDGDRLTPVSQTGVGVHLGALCDILGGSGLIGTNHPVIKPDGEGPLRKSKIKPFRIGQTPVSNREFAAFVDETSFVSEAERFGWSFVFYAQVPKSQQTEQGSQGAQWWRRVDGATWNQPTGPHSPAYDPDHPAVHLSWNDA